MLLACTDSAEVLVKKRVTKAFEALSHHSWPPAVRGTAAAIALESAQAICAAAFIQEVGISE